MLKTAIKLYHKFNQYTEAVRLAIRLNDLTLIKELFLLCPDRYIRQCFLSGSSLCMGHKFVLRGVSGDLKLSGNLGPLGGMLVRYVICHLFRSTKMQIAFILAHSQVYLELDEQSDGYDELMEIMSNSRLNAYHLQLARELDIAEPKNPEDVYKSHLEQHRKFFPILCRQQ